MPRPTAASPGQERLVKQISDSDQSCTGNNAILRENAGNNKEQGDERSRATNFVVALHNHEAWHNYAPFKGSAGSGTSGRLGQGSAG